MTRVKIPKGTITLRVRQTGVALNVPTESGIRVGASVDVMMTSLETEKSGRRQC